MSQPWRSASEAGSRAVVHSLGIDPPPACPRTRGSPERAQDQRAPTFPFFSTFLLLVWRVLNYNHYEEAPELIEVMSRRRSCSYPRARVASSASDFSSSGEGTGPSRLQQSRSLYSTAHGGDPSVEGHELDESPHRRTHTSDHGSPRAASSRGSPRGGYSRHGSGENSAQAIRLPWYAKKISHLVRFPGQNLATVQLH